MLGANSIRKGYGILRPSFIFLSGSAIAVAGAYSLANPGMLENILGGTDAERLLLSGSSVLLGALSASCFYEKPGFEANCDRCATECRKSIYFSP